MFEPAYTTATRLRNARVGASGRSAWAPLGLAAGCAAAAALLYLIVTRVPAVRVRDASLLYHATLLRDPAIEAAGNFLLALLEPLLFVLWGGAALAIALARGRPRLGIAAVATMALAPLTSETLKPLLAHRHASVGGVHIGAASWPSGHSTAALSLALAVVIVAPAGRRALVAIVGAAFAAIVGVVLLILSWHMPSDVLGGYLVAALWGALALAALRGAERLRPSPGRA